uniref:Fe2OG dioxygenase domain-containing protein n=1 Tax=Phytophthora ramorum TaxID=164328 RepID=H3H6H7_PHYRM
MDEKVRKSWELAPDQVQIKNPLWKAGMDTLSEIIAGRLGYKGVSMQCKLYKLLLYGEGGHFVKHQDTEKEDGMVATLVVQPPSEHKGGNLVVYRGGKAAQRHDFGKKDGTAAYLSHYAVHYADAEHALEKVTKGYRLALVFSICLPPNMHHLIRNHDIPLSEELAAAMGRLNSDTDSFALMFSHEYTEQSITDLGTRALKGIDRARVEALEEANAILPDEKKLYFYLAELTLDANFYDTGGDWEESERDESINWYSTSGESLGSGMDEIELNFLNPGRESLAEWWEGHKNSSFEGYTIGNEEATGLTKYVDYATIACPVV